MYVGVLESSIRVAGRMSVIRTSGEKANSARPRCLISSEALMVGSSIQNAPKDTAPAPA